MKLTWHAWAKAGMFCAVGLMCALFVVNTLSVPVRGATIGYLAQFSSVEGLNVGNPVLMDGVRIGRVSSIRFADNGNGTARADVVVYLDVDAATGPVAFTLAKDNEVWATARFGDGVELDERVRLRAAVHRILTDELVVEPLTGNAVLNGIPVRLAPVAALV